MLRLPTMQDQNFICPLCQTPSNFIYKHSKSEKKNYRCTNCAAIFLPSIYFLSPDAEKKFYQKHQNDIYDLGYQQFALPLVDEVLKRCKKETLGLDFGSGTGPVLSYLLKKNDYQINQYDPYFSPDTKVLEKKYDFIASCEVVEHFHHPYQEFLKFKNMLNPKAPLIISTSLYHESIDLKDWYYIRDPTHVFIYSKETFLWIKKEFGFCDVEFISNRLVVLLSS